MWIKTTAHLQKTLGKSWRDNKELGIEDKAEYEAMKSLSINKLYCTKNCQFLLMLQQACIPSSCTNIQREAEALRFILCTHEVEEMISRSTFPHCCVNKPWKMPAVKAWALMILKYEGVSDAVSGNFLRDFTDLLSSAQAPGGQRCPLSGHHSPGNCPCGGPSDALVHRKWNFLSDANLW
mmetsp:Transcript_32197/g.66649  ORF Transcript_32197/g.66649 Transcript_32197/m.66649 type:complete len:180 (+) Transcript_32197:540-1079(+)